MTHRHRTAVGVAGLIAAAVAVKADALGRGVLLAAPLCALFVVLGVFAAQLGVRDRGEPVRVAELSERRIRDYVPSRLTGAVVVSAATLTGMLALTSAHGSADDLGRAGRVLARRCSALSSETHGAWAGSFYSLPLSIVVLSGIAVGLITLHRVVRRARPGNPTDVRDSDDAVRRTDAGVVVAALGVLISVPLVGVSLVTAGALLGISCRPPLWTGLALTILLLVPAWLGLFGVCSLRLLSQALHVRSSLPTT